MSKMAWERAAGTAAKLATVSMIAAIATTGVASAESAQTAPGAKVPASYGQPTAAPAWGQPAWGQPGFAAAPYGQPGAAFGMAPAYGAAPFGAPTALPRPGIDPATASSGLTPKLPEGAAQMPAQFAKGQMPAPHFGQRLPIFANTTANGITYGPPSYTPPEGFDPKTASSSPFPSDWHRPAWGQRQPGMPPQAAGRPQMPMPMPSLAGAPVYGAGAWGQQPLSPASISRFAPAEPSYAPAEPLRPNYAAAPATYEPVEAAAAPIPAAPVQAAPATSQTYSYEMAPTASAPMYVGQSTEIGSSYTAGTASADPYEVVIGQSGEVKSIDGGMSYDAAAYQAAPAYEPAPAYQAAPAYEAAPAYQAAPAYEMDTSGYEMTTEVPAYDAATTYGTEGYAPAPAYQAALPQTGYDSSSFSSGSNHFVQVGAFRNVARAERLVRKLQEAGEQPIVTQATVRGKLFHRVRVPAMDKRDAKMVQSRIRGLGYYEARMVRG